MSDELHDDEDEDPKLTSMRAVWLQMRDEDPPKSGLAELLAAARTQADAMAKPSWWKRVATLLRRPPVFALATVMIVLGGALLIGRRVEPSQDPTPRIETKDRAETTAGHAMSTEKLPPAPPPPPEAPHERPIPRVRTEHYAEPPRTQPAPGMIGGEVEERSAPPPKPMQDPGPSDEVVLDGSSKTAATADRNVGPVDDLVEKCETAARNGDCAAVRTMVKRIEKSDRSYRKRVARDSPVGKCLE